MSSEIEGHIARKYEIKKRLGKGVRLNWICIVGDLINVLIMQFYSGP